MVDNALRCIEEDYPALVALAQAMGVLDDSGNAVHGITWDYIGFKRVGPAPENDEPDNRPFLTNAQNKKYVHVNVRTPFSVGQAAAEAAALNPAIAAALGDPARFFVTNPDGSPKDPEVPMRIFL